MNKNSEISIYIDVTSTINTLHTTGIQRVVKKFATEFQEFGLEKIFFVKFSADGKYRKIKFDWQKTAKSHKNSNHYKKLQSKLLSSIRSVVPDTIKRGARRALSIFIKLLEAAIGSFWRKDAIVSVEPGDLFLMIDASWNYLPWSEIRRMRKEGAVISHVIYDLLPLKHPQFFTKELVDAFEIWSKMISYYCSNFYCISYTVKKDVEKFIHPLAGNQFNLIDVIPLGNDIRPSNKNNMDQLHVPRPKKRSKFLSVGTIEPRKNYQFVLDAFNEVWGISGNEEVTWTIVGRVGWSSHKLYSELKNHPEFGRRLRLFVDANDELLMALYEESSCVIAASIDEGYGLPVVEAAEHNCAILLSDIEIFREFKLEEFNYFSIGRKKDLIEKIHEEKNASEKFNAINICQTTWKEASKVFYKKLRS